MKYIFLVLLLSPACTKTSSPIDDKSANEMLRKLDEINTMLNYQGKLTEGNLRLDSMSAAVQKANHPAVSATWHRMKCAYWLTNQNYDSSIYHNKEAQRHARQISDTNLHLLDAMSQNITLLTRKGEYFRALTEGHKTYQLAKRIDTFHLSLVCLRISEPLLSMGLMSEARRYLLEALSNAPNPSMAEVIRHTAMAAEYSMPPEQLDSAILYYEKPERLQMLKQPYARAVLLYHVGNLHAVRGNSLRFEQYLLQALQFSRNTTFANATVYRDLAYINTHAGNPDKSDRYLDTAEMILRDSIIPQRELGQVFLQRAENMKLRGHHKAAAAWQDSAIIHQQKDDDLQQIANDLNEDTKLNRQASDQKISSLDASNKANLKISQQQKTILLMVISGSILLLTIILLLFRRRQLQNKVRQTQLELSLLRTQMEPHFLFNALSVLQHRIGTSRPHEANQYLSQLSRLLKITLQNARKNYVPLTDEVDALESYLSMQQMQSGTFDYELTVFEGYRNDDLLIPPMLLQPFVENAIHHGVLHLPDRRGRITVTIERQQHTLRCVIDDNGRGRPQSEAENTSRSTAITRQRLEILTKLSRVKASLTVQDKAGPGESGVKVVLIIPYQ